MTTDDEITQETDTAQVKETSRHLALGAAVEKFYDELSGAKRVMVDGFLPKEIIDLLKNR